MTDINCNEDYVRVTEETRQEELMPLEFRFKDHIDNIVFRTLKYLDDYSDFREDKMGIDLDRIEKLADKLGVNAFRYRQYYMRRMYETK